jgi:hypothetical protein
VGAFGEISTEAEYPLKNNLSATTSPTVSDDSTAGYEAGSVWIDNTKQLAFKCLSAAVGAAIWWIAAVGSSYNFGLYAQTAQSTPITNTTVETSLIGTGEGSLSVPANQFSIGDSYHGKIGGEMSAVNAETIQIRIKTGSVVLGDTGLITLPNITNKFWEAELDFTIRQTGVATSASIISNGQFVYTSDAHNRYEGAGENFVNNTTFDTTVLNTLDITAEWGSANVGNTIQSDFFVLTKTY